MKRAVPGRRLFPVLFTLLLAALACGPRVTPTRSISTKKPTLTQGVSKPAETKPVKTKPVKTATFSALPSTDTPTSIPPTDTYTITPTLSAWLFVAGTWSGCVDAPTPLVPYLAYPCTGAIENFVTLYLKSHCVIGEYCGNYVKGRFESEFILLELTLIGIQGSVVWMHGEASGMFSWATTDVTIERAGANVRIEEKAASQYIHVLPPGCDSVIQTQTGIGCYEHVP